MSGIAYTVKSTYATAVRRTGSALTAVGLLPEEIPPLERRRQHWVSSLFKVHDSLAIAEMGVPWWTYNAIEKVESWLADRAKPIRVFEYGTGASSIWLSGRVDEVITVEHHRGFAESIGPELAKYPNIKLHVVEPVESANPVVPSGKSGAAGLDFANYVGTIDKVDGGPYDLIVIDGRAREACLRAAVPHLAEDGLILFDNSRRRRYRSAIEESGLREFRLSGLTPTLPYTDQTSLLLR